MKQNDVNKNYDGLLIYYMNCIKEKTGKVIIKEQYL